MLREVRHADLYVKEPLQQPIGGRLQGTISDLIQETIIFLLAVMHSRSTAILQIKPTVLIVNLFSADLA